MEGKRRTNNYGSGSESRKLKTYGSYRSWSSSRTNRRKISHFNIYCLRLINSVLKRSAYTENSWTFIIISAPYP